MRARGFCFSDVFLGSSSPNSASLQRNPLITSKGWNFGVLQGCTPRSRGDGDVKGGIVPGSSELCVGGFWLDDAPHFPFSPPILLQRDAQLPHLRSTILEWSQKSQCFVGVMMKFPFPACLAQGVAQCEPFPSLILAFHAAGAGSRWDKG